MSDGERIWALTVGVVGLIAFAGGSLLAAVPRIDATIDSVLDTVTRRRAQILVGTGLSVTGSALLLWPVTTVSSSISADVWRSLAVASVLVWTLGFAFLVVASLLAATAAWRGPASRDRDGLDPSTIRALLDASHLSAWSVSAPIGAIAVVATTVVGIQADQFTGAIEALIVLAAAAKVVTVVIEVAGTRTRTGWNAGGWAAGSSGYATVAWFALLLASLA